MRFRLSTLIGMVIIIGGASIVGRVVKVISLKKQDYSEDINHLQEFQDEENSDKIRDALTNKTDHLIWFLQISDLHFSIFHDQSRISNFEEFATQTIDILKPSVVLASGDLTDGKKLDSVGSRQYIEEWQVYKNILQKTNIKNKTVWLDIRGNHDNFDVPSLSSQNNFYQKYSMQGPNHQRSYMYTYKNGYDSVSFIAVDACLLPGPRRPFNFIGVLPSAEMEALKKFKKESRKSNYTIWFGHYPTSCIISADPGIRQLMKDSLAYLCGHLHTLAGFLPNLYTRQQTGSLELELGDWKDSRIFRIAAIDHGLFSFADVHLGEWPIVLITNPKNTLFSMSRNEPLHLIAQSTHVRVLVWSIDPILKVKLRFNEGKSWKSMYHIDGPLYVAAWDPLVYSKGMHIIEVLAEDSMGRKKYVSQLFSMDGSQPDFTFWSRVILMSNVSFVFQFLFGISVFLCVVPLCVLRLMHKLVQEKKMMRPRVRFSFLKLWIRKLWVACCIGKLFWPLVLATIYLPIGPWFVGEVMDGHIGVVFAWGTFVFSSYLPGSLTYAYGFVQAILYHFPLILLTANSADLRLQAIFMRKPSPFSIVANNVLFGCLIISQAMNAYFFLLAYGALALVLGPLRTWSVFLGIYLWYRSSTLREKDLRVVACVWNVGNTCIISYTDNTSTTTDSQATAQSQPYNKNEEERENFPLDVE